MDQGAWPRTHQTQKQLRVLTYLCGPARNGRRPVTAEIAGSNPVRGAELARPHEVRHACRSPPQLPRRLGQGSRKALLVRAGLHARPAHFGESFNGRTTDSDSVYPGSNPGSPAIRVSFNGRTGDFESPNRGSNPCARAENVSVRVRTVRNQSSHVETVWGLSSSGRALRWQRRGGRFKSDRLHRGK